jgi:primosomal protein N'
MTVRCQWCGDELTFYRGSGYAHSGGGAYVMHCLDCGHQDDSKPSKMECPACGSKNWVDHHCALPVSDEQDSRGRDST